MTRLDDLLDTAADDLRDAVDRMLASTAQPITATPGHEIEARELAHRRPSRRVLVSASVGLAAAAVLGLLALAPGRSNDEPGIGASTTVSANPTPTFRPLELPDSPAGYVELPKIVRPAVRDQLRSAVFVKRDGAGNIIERVIARAGDTSQSGRTARRIFSSDNLPTAFDGSVAFSDGTDDVYVQFALGGDANLVLEAHHGDSLTRDALATEMVGIVAVLRLSLANDISFDGALPEGWEMAVTGQEPWNVGPTYVQVFEVDQPDGGAKVIVSNLPSTDPGMPYWEMVDTLTPIEVRGRAGFLSLDSTQTGNLAPVPILIWPESDGHWVTLRADGLTAEQLLEVAARLRPADGEWTAGSNRNAATTTSLPGG